MARLCTIFSLPNCFVMTSYHWNAVQNTSMQATLTKQYNEWQHTWRHAQNLVSLRVLCKFVSLISTLVVCLKFAFIEMLDTGITYIVCLCKNWYQVLPVVWTNRITTVILVHKTGSNWYKVLYHHTMYVMGIYPQLKNYNIF